MESSGRRKQQTRISPKMVLVLLALAAGSFFLFLASLGGDSASEPTQIIMGVLTACLLSAAAILSAILAWRAWRRFRASAGHGRPENG
jgi:protein-S-isoprenylcysteine O-methyltransferase Ste14